jgi:hypothetical protein
MKYTFGLNVKEIQRVRNELLKIKKKLPLMTKDFLEDVALWLINRANFHLNNSDIGENVKIDIRNGWTYEFTANGIKITNTTDKAVFVEFGVGIVGQQDAHPQASAEGYEYNKDSPYKDRKGTGTWVFKSTLQNLDLPQANVQFAYNNTNSDYAIVTQGAKGVWYAYNAIVDANMELAKANGGEIGALWEKVKREYIK